MSIIRRSLASDKKNPPGSSFIWLNCSLVGYGTYLFPYLGRVRFRLGNEEDEQIDAWRTWTETFWGCCCTSSFCSSPRLHSSLLFLFPLFFPRIVENGLESIRQASSQLPIPLSHPQPDAQRRPANQTPLDPALPPLKPTIISMAPRGSPSWNSFEKRETETWAKFYVLIYTETPG